MFFISDFFSLDNEIHIKRIELCTEMTNRFFHKRPDCEDILKRKNSWAMSEKELRKELIPKLDDENLIYSILKSQLNI
jgi:hypothetical protein